MADKLKHTPGTWITNTKLNGYYAVENNGGYPNGRVICTLNGNFPPEADARLIAAAPELLEALKEVHTKMQQVYWNVMTPQEKADTWCQCSKIIETAIAKAEGK